MRYTKGSGCVHCAKQATQDIRDAARAAAQGERGFTPISPDELDIPDGARYEEDIDSLM